MLNQRAKNTRFVNRKAFVFFALLTADAMPTTGLGADCLITDVTNIADMCMWVGLYMYYIFYDSYWISFGIEYIITILF